MSLYKRKLRNYVVCTRDNEIPAVRQSTCNPRRLPWFQRGWSNSARSHSANSQLRVDFRRRRLRRCRRLYLLLRYQEELSSPDTYKRNRSVICHELPPLSLCPSWSVFTVDSGRYYALCYVYVCSKVTENIEDWFGLYYLQARLSRDGTKLPQLIEIAAVEPATCAFDKKTGTFSK